MRAVGGADRLAGTPGRRTCRPHAGHGPPRRRRRWRGRATPTSRSAPSRSCRSTAVRRQRMIDPIRRPRRPVAASAGVGVRPPARTADDGLMASRRTVGVAMAVPDRRRRRRRHRRSRRRRRARSGELTSDGPSVRLTGRARRGERRSSSSAPSPAVSDGPRRRPRPIDPDAGFRTRLVELSVERTLAGESPTPLVVEEPAELLDGTPLVVDGMIPLEAGDRAVWFLVAGGSDEQPYHAVVNAQGRYEVVGDTLRPSRRRPARRTSSPRSASRALGDAVARIVGPSGETVEVPSWPWWTADDAGRVPTRGSRTPCGRSSAPTAGSCSPCASARWGRATSPTRRRSRRSSRRGGRRPVRRRRELGPWLATIARRTSIDIHRRESRRPTTPLDDVPPADSSVVELPVGVERSYEVAEVRAAIDALPADEREVVRLQHLEELTHTEVAERLGVPVGTVKSRSFRAHRHLAARLGHLREAG